jgi:DNA repair exonuclease SbcCD nuclease subunit
MRLLATSDWHLDWNTAGLRRFQDLRRAVLDSVQYAIGNKVDSYLFLGDLMNPDSGSRVFECMALAIHAANQLAEAGIESHWLTGNHDVIEDGSGCSTLEPLTAVHGQCVNVHDRPMMTCLRCRGGALTNIDLVTLPFTPAVHTYDPQDIVKRYIKPDGLTVLAGHMTDIPGILPGSETRDMARGRSMRFPIDALRGSNVLMLNGHFHEQQLFKGIYIPGSLERLTFGEQHHRPGWLIIDV